MPIPRYPHVKVPLVGESPNVYDIIARTAMNLLGAGHQQEALDFQESASAFADAGQFQEVLQLVTLLVDTTGDTAIGTCFYCDQPAVDADTDMCAEHQ